MNWSFVICTDGKTNVNFHSSIIKSIKKQNISRYEILFITEYSGFNMEEDNVSTIHISTPREMHITFKMNKAIRFCTFENLCFLHDYIILADNWYDRGGSRKRC